MKQYLFSNWKMYLDHDQQMALAKQIKELSDLGVQQVVFPNALSFMAIHDVLKSTSVQVGMQHVIAPPQGGYTGETSAYLAHQAEATHALVGHSEQRHVFGESNEDIAKQFLACLDADIIPVLCVGETAEDKAENRQEYRVKKQLLKALTGAPKEAQFFVAYEPVWAISQSGVGEACDPEYAEHMLAYIRTELEQYTTQSIPLLYGGSINEKNVVSFMKKPHIDGVLVGSASTDFEKYRLMIEQIV